MLRKCLSPITQYLTTLEDQDMKISYGLRLDLRSDLRFPYQTTFSCDQQPTKTAINKHPTNIYKVCYARGKCTNSGLPLRTVFACGEPGLHVENCFKIYHTKLNYGDIDE